MGSVSLANCSIGEGLNFITQASVFPLKRLVCASCLMQKCREFQNTKTGRKMKTQKLVLITAALAFIGACATEPEKPAPKPAPPPPPKAAPAPAAQPVPAPRVEAPKPAPTPEAPKKPAIVNLASTEL